MARIQIIMHRLRHLFTNELINVDAPVTSFQKLMGHCWIETYTGHFGIRPE